jgi:penicillin-binding protein 1A
LYSVFDPITRRMRRQSSDPLDQAEGMLPGDAGSAAGGQPPYETADDPVPSRGRRRRWVKWGLIATPILFLLLVVYLLFTAPLSKSLQPPVPPSITLLSAEGTPIARRGATIGEPVDAAKLPDHVVNAFIAIEDRRFRTHWGIDPRGIARAAWNNLWAGGVRQGGSTITQQLAKNAFLTSDRTATRKMREVIIAFWLEAWLSKDQILSRYLSNVYFGDNVYGLRAAARHYFDRDPDDLNVGQAAMLAGLVQAPSRLAPTKNLAGARARQKLVVGAMVDAGLLDKAEAVRVRPARIVAQRPSSLPNGTYFADWVMPEARGEANGLEREQTVRTTLEMPVQHAAERAVRNAGLRQAQVAIVVMRPDGRVVAMVGGKRYADSPFNRATQARRQPGSTFKLFVYLAALRAGMTPDSTVEDEPVQIGEWAPKNSDGQYRGTITLREAFARSSNVAAARLIHQVGPKAVIQAARDLGISTPIPEEASIALGTSTVSLLELTAAYAAVANGDRAPRPQGLADAEEPGWLATFMSKRRPLSEDEVEGLRDLLASTVRSGTGRGAALPIGAFGKTGTTQDKRDVLFIGYAGGLVAGVWVGNDDNTPNPGLTSALPARIWRSFMAQALGVAQREVPEERREELPVDLDEMINGIAPDDIEFEMSEDGLSASVRGSGVQVRLDQNGVEVRGEGQSDRRAPSSSNEAEPTSP